jgi:hypothetical protein
MAYLVEVPGHEDQHFETMDEVNAHYFTLTADERLERRVTNEGRLAEVKALMEERGCSREWAVHLLTRPETQGPGRPLKQSTERVRQIMAEKNCSYGTAYQQARREAAGVKVGKPGRPKKEKTDEPS